MRKSFNELERYHQILENGFAVSSFEKPTRTITSGDFVAERQYTYGISDLVILIKGLSADGYKPKAIKEKVKELWLNWSPILDAGVIDKYIRKIRRKKDYFLSNVTEVHVSQEFIDFVISLPERSNLVHNRPITRKAQQLYFVLYVWSQVQKQCHKKAWKWVEVSNDERRLKRVAGGLHGPLYEYTGPLCDAGLLDCPVNAKGLVFVVKDEFPEGDIVIDPENPMEYLESILGPDVKLHECPGCGKMIPGRAGSYCEDCKREKERLKKQRQRAKAKEEQNDSIH